MNLLQLRLIRHDLFLLRNFWLGLMGSGVEKITFWIGVVFISLISYSALRGLATAIGKLPMTLVALYFFVLGFFVQNFVATRLSGFVSGAIFSTDALLVRYRFLYGLCCGLAVIILSMPLILVFLLAKTANQSLLTLCLVPVSCAVGAIFHMGAYRIFLKLRIVVIKAFTGGHTGRDRTAGSAGRMMKFSALCAIRQTPFAEGRLSALCLTGLLAIVAAGAVHFLAPTVGKTGLFALTIVLYCLPLFLLTRLDHVFIKYASSVGYQLPEIIFAHVVAASIYTVIFSLFSLVLFADSPLIVIGLIWSVWLASSLIVAVRICYYLTLQKKKADFVIQAEFLVALLLATVFPPLAAVVLGVRWILAWRKARAMVWMPA